MGSVDETSTTGRRKGSIGKEHQRREEMTDGRRTKCTENVKDNTQGVGGHSSPKETPYIPSAEKPQTT